MSTEPTPDLHTELAADIARWAYEFPIASWSLASGDAAVSLAKEWGSQAANAVLLGGLRRRVGVAAAERAEIEREVRAKFADEIAQDESLHKLLAEGEDGQPVHASWCVGCRAERIARGGER